MTRHTNEKTEPHGQAWIGDWRTRIKRRLEQRRAPNIEALADIYPTSSLIDLATVLSIDDEKHVDRSDVAADQLAEVWREDVAPRGIAGAERMARRLLVGELHRNLPGGWVQNWEDDDDSGSPSSRLTRLFALWTRQVGEEHRKRAHDLFRGMVAEGRAGHIAPGWLPSSAADDLLCALFERYWKGER